jgi:Xaa-Pro aminopeptidase
MFDRDTYIERRAGLSGSLEGGLVLLPGNGHSPMNYADNEYAFRQDSTFLYYFGLNQPDLAGVIDVDSGESMLFGDELTVEQIVWMGALPTIAAGARQAGIEGVRPRRELAEVVGSAQAGGRRVRYLPPYRAEITLQLAELLGVDVNQVSRGACRKLVRAVVAQRSYKSAEEVAEIARAVATSVAMHEAAIRMAAPGVTERAIAAEVERVARVEAERIAYPVIGTINGQTLHNHVQKDTLSAGNIFLLDCGAETARGYAGDLTTSFPVSPRFTERQQGVYDILMRAYDAAVAKSRPGVRNLEVHLAAARVIFDGLKDLGIAHGDTEAAVAAGAHALVFPHGIGHMMGLDVHDMENLGEDLVGYAEQARSTQFGLKSLRLARELEPGFVVTIEPGIYFIPQLIDDWRGRNHCAGFLHYGELEKWRDFGGVRNEENFLITAEGAQRIGPRKPQTPEDFDALRV